MLGSERFTRSTGIRISPRTRPRFRHPRRAPTRIGAALFSVEATIRVAGAARAPHVGCSGAITDPRVWLDPGSDSKHQAIGTCTDQPGATFT